MCIFSVFSRSLHLSFAWRVQCCVQWRQRACKLKTKTCRHWQVIWIQICSSKTADGCRKQCNSCIINSGLPLPTLKHIFHLLLPGLKFPLSCNPWTAPNATTEETSQSEMRYQHGDVTRHCLTRQSLSQSQRSRSDTKHTHIVTWQYQPVRGTVIWAACVEALGFSQP